MKTTHLSGLGRYGLLGLLLVGLLFATLVSTPSAGAQTPVHFFEGKVSDLSIDGNPVLIGSKIIALDASGNGIGGTYKINQNSITHDFWGTGVPADLAEVRFALIAPQDYHTSELSQPFAVGAAGDVTSGISIAFKSKPPPQLGPVPHLFYGLIDSVLVDGQPLSANTDIELIDANGTTVAITRLTDDGLYWYAPSPSDLQGGKVRFRVGTAVSESYELTQGSITEIDNLVLTSPATTPPPTADMFQTDLRFGWNLITYTGDTLPVAQALADINGMYRSAFTYDSATQSFKSYFPTLPAALNSLQQLEAGDAVWIFMEQSVAWNQDRMDSGANTQLVEGFNLVSFAGADGTSVEDAFASLSGTSYTVWMWDSQSQSYLSYSPDRPAFLNTLETLDHGTAIWILVDGATTWTQP